MKRIKISILFLSISILSSCTIFIKVSSTRASAADSMRYKRESFVIADFPQAGFSYTNSCAHLVQHSNVSAKSKGFTKTAGAITYQFVEQ